MRERALYKKRGGPRWGYEKNLLYQRKYQREYAARRRAEDPEWARAVDKRGSAYRRRKRASDPSYAILRRLRSRFSNAMRLYAAGKTMTANEYGIDYSAIIEHLGECPGERSEWHIDHIRPLSSFDLHDLTQVREAFAPANHQWLPAVENMSKGASL